MRRGLRNLLKSLGSHYDPNSEQIVASNKFTYLHEERHRQQKIIILVLSYWYICVSAALGFLSLIAGIWWGILLFLIPTIIMLTLELDAWV